MIKLLMHLCIGLSGLWLSSSLGLAQNMQPLRLEIQSVALNEQQSALEYTSISTDLQYDFQAQYPYYTTQRNDWQVGEMLQLNIQKLPDSAFCYIFSIDPLQNIQHYWTSDTVSQVQLPLTLPDTSHALTIDSPGKAYWCIWISNRKIEPFKRLSEGVELTTGSIMQRMSQTLGNVLLLPQDRWYLTAKEIGIDLHNNLLSMEKQWVLPLIVKMDIPKVQIPTPPITPKDSTNRPSPNHPQKDIRRGKK